MFLLQVFPVVDRAIENKKQISQQLDVTTGKSATFFDIYLTKKYYFKDTTQKTIEDYASVFIRYCCCTKTVCMGLCWYLNQEPHYCASPIEYSRNKTQ